MLGECRIEIKIILNGARCVALPKGSLDRRDFMMKWRAEFKFHEFTHPRLRGLRTVRPGGQIHLPQLVKKTLTPHLPRAGQAKSDHLLPRPVPCVFATSRALVELRRVIRAQVAAASTPPPTSPGPASLEQLLFAVTVRHALSSPHATSASSSASPPVDARGVVKAFDAFSSYLPAGPVLLTEQARPSSW